MWTAVWRETNLTASWVQVQAIRLKNMELVVQWRKASHGSSKLFHFGVFYFSQIFRGTLGVLMTEHRTWLALWDWSISDRMVHCGACPRQITLLVQESEDVLDAIDPSLRHSGILDQSLSVLAWLQQVFLGWWYSWAFSLYKSATNYLESCTGRNVRCLLGWSLPNMIWQELSV